MSRTKYIPALRFKWLTPLYDFFINLTMPEQEMKKALIEAANISSKMKVLDFGCGTATLTIAVKESYPAAKVTGIDVDREILDKAIQKVKAKKLDILLLDYDGSHLPFQNKSFERILSCLVFHHLDTTAKRKALAEAFRILGNNGELLIADFGRSRSWLQRTLFNIIRGLDGYKSTDANAKGLLPELMGEAGFNNVTINKRFKTIFGEVQIIRAEKIYSE